MSANDLSPERREIVTAIFNAPFMTHLGFHLIGLGRGWCESALDVIEERHKQQDGFLHAGVVATMADHTAGTSSGTLAPDGVFPLTVEFKINLLRPGIADRLRCRAEVLKAGRTITVSESSVYANHKGEEKLIAKATVTLAMVERSLMTR